MRTAIAIGVLLAIFLIRPDSASGAAEVLVIGDPDAEVSAELLKAAEVEGVKVSGLSDLEGWDFEAMKKYAVIVIATDLQGFGNTQDRDLKKFVSAGGGVILLGGAGDCFFKEANYTGLVGAIFGSFSGKIQNYTVNTEAAAHPAIEGVGTIEASGARIGHEEFHESCVVLQTRDGEPWTWARKSGKGRVFYTGFTGDAAVMNHSGFRTLLRNAIRWAAGE